MFTDNKPFYGFGVTNTQIVNSRPNMLHYFLKALNLFALFSPTRLMIWAFSSSTDVSLTISCLSNGLKHAQFNRSRVAYKITFSFSAFFLMSDVIFSELLQSYYLLFLSFRYLRVQLTKIKIANIHEQNKNKLPETSHPKPASAHWSLISLHSSSALQCNHRNIKPEFTRTK